MTKLRSKRGKRTGKKRTGDRTVQGSDGDGMKEESMREFSAVVQQSGADSEPDEDRFLTGDEKVFNAGIALAEYCTRHLEPFMEFLDSVRDEELTLDGLDKCCSFVVSNDESDDSGVGFSALDNSGARVARGSSEKISFVKESSYQDSASEELLEVSDRTPGAVDKIISEDSSSKELENSTESSCEATCSGSPGPRRRHGYRKLISDESDEDDQPVKKNEDNPRANLLPFSPDITSFRAVTRPQDQLPTQRSLLQQFEALAVDSTQPASAPDETELSRKDAGTPPNGTNSNTEVEITSDEDIKVLLVKDPKDSAKVRSKRTKSQTRKASGSYPLTRRNRQTELSLCETSSPSTSRSTSRSTRLRCQASREESLNLDQSRDVEILSEITRSKSFNSNKVAAESSKSKAKNAANIGAARRSSRKRSNKSPRRAIPSDSEDDIKVISPAPLAKKMKVVKPRPSRSSHGRYSLRSKT